MDKNSAIGLTLIALLLLVYFYWFAPTTQPVPPTKQSVPSLAETKSDTLRGEPAPAADSLLVAQLGVLGSSLEGTETTTRVETEDLDITFSNRGGIIKDLELKKFKTYHKAPLKLITPTSNEFSLRTSVNGRDLDLYTLYYQVDQQKSGDTTIVNFSIPLANGKKFVQTYKIPAQGHEIKYTIKGGSEIISGENLSFNWVSILKPLEKDLVDTRENSTINYYSDEDGFSKLDPRASGTETETVTDPLKWVTIKEKFFLRAFITSSQFGGGQLETNVNESDPSVVKRANVKLNVPKSALSDGTYFKFFFGPNDYQKIGKVSDGFAKNVYLGWPPIYWINKFIIFPVFNLLTQFISNYGLIIIILVFLLKLVLFPLSYRSYLSMAKMRVLKPELDEIKERVGEDMTKVQQEQMKLYSQVGVNPISGCVPVLLQMPLIFAMFYLFPASIELRQQPLFWAEDLSTYDSLIHFSFDIPFLGNHLSLFTLLMTISTLIYTWQNNQLSAVQGPMKSVSYVMPVIFLFVLNRFSAGLTFYYLISNLFTFAQQAIIKRFVDEDKIKAIMEENRKKIAAGGGTAKKSKFMSKLEDAMKAGEEARKRADEERKKKKK
ncbi:membrane protein insertase YidC [Chryseolinea sp. T2]|uniref:membrane protein insertase YidC n=1 Tax=Chryseolinea sp. T2 TaxID=3129255 RepID=UPI00307692FF